MRSPNVRMPVETLDDMGEHHWQATQFFEETSALGVAFKPVLDSLRESAVGYAAAKKALIAPRLKVNLGNLNIDAAIRVAASTAKIADGGKAGTFFATLFPEGQTAMLVYMGQKQAEVVYNMLSIAEARGLLDHELLGPVLAKLKTRCDEFVAAHEERKQAYDNLAQAQAAFELAKEEFVEAYSRNIGLIRSIYPTDRNMREFFFLNPTKRYRSEEEEEEAEQEA